MLGTIERQGLICNGSLGSPERQGEGGTRRWNAVGGSLSLAAPRTPEPSVLVPPAVVFSLCPSLSLSLTHTDTHTHVSFARNYYYLEMRKLTSWGTMHA